LRATPLWLTGTSSLSEAAVAGASSSMVGMIEIASREIAYERKRPRERS
jgi:hypothetical protein